MLITLFLFIQTKVIISQAICQNSNNLLIQNQEEQNIQYNSSNNCSPPNNLTMQCFVTYNNATITFNGTINFTFFNTNCSLIIIQASNIYLGSISTTYKEISSIDQKILQIEANYLSFNENSIIDMTDYLIALYFNSSSDISNIKWHSNQALFASDNSINFVNSTFHITDRTCSNKVNILPGLSNLYNQTFQDVEQYLIIQQDKQITPINFTLFLQVSNYTFLILSKQSINVMQTQINGSQIAILGKQIIEIQNSILNTSGLGCQINEGQQLELFRNARGPVFVNYNQKCYGNGGSNSGYGGIGMNEPGSLLEDCIFLTNSTRFMFDLYPYGYLLSHLYQGSGGSSAYMFRFIEQMKKLALNYGSGGGSIFFSSLNISLITTQLLADGQPGYIAQKNNVTNFSTGGGAGGSIKLYSASLGSDSLTNISAQGGNSDESGSVGEGGGGIIQFKCSSNPLDNASNLSAFCSNSTFSGSILFSKGLRNNSQTYLFGQTGSLLGPLCPPGYEVDSNFSCVLCQNKYYSLWWSDQCIPCPFTYGNLTNSTFCNVPLSCSADECCIEDFKILRNTGIQLVIFLLLIIIGYALRRQYKKRDQVTEKNFDFVNATKDIIAETIITQSLVENDQFVLGDLLYHAHRIHVIGNNTYLNPWYLHLEPPMEIEQAIIKEEYEKFAKNFNKFAQWSKSKYIILNILAILYYPLYWGWQTKIKKDKFQLLQSYLNKNEINKFWKQQSDDSYSRFKITKSADYTLLYIDIFNYKNCELKYIYLTCPFIIYLSGEGNYVRPFYLCESDQFLVSLFFAVNKTKNSTQNRQNILNNLVSVNERQENSKEIRSFLKKFNKVAMTLDFGAFSHNFVSNFKRLFDLLEKWNNTFFSDHNVKLQLIIAQYPFDVSHQSASYTLIEMKSESKFEAFLKELHKNVTLQELQDVKFGIFIFNTDQDPSVIEQQLQNQKFSFNEYEDFSINHLEHEYDEEHSLDVALLREQFLSKNTEKDQQQLAHVKHQFKQITQKQSQRSNSKYYHHIVRIFDYVRFQAFSHKRTFLDKYTLIIMICILILLDNFLLQSILSLIIEKSSKVDNGEETFRFQIILYPYPFAIILSNLFESVWIPSQSYGILKLYLIFNAMAILQYVLSLIIITTSNNKFCIKDSLTILSLLIKIALNQLSERLIPMSTKLNQLSNDNSQN